MVKLQNSQSFPSPNASGFKLYTDIPISNFTGTPTVEIPIYTIKEGALTLPITLSYHTGSVRVHSRPSWVGLGWNLMAGGAITRIVHGEFDEFQHGSDPDNPATQGAGFYNKYASLGGGETEWYSDARMTQYRDNYLPAIVSRVESMADEFNFNFNGYSGKFFLDHEGNWKVISDDEIKIVFDPTWGNGFIKKTDLRSRILKIMTDNGFINEPGLSNRYFNKFTLITPDGTSYEFGGKDATEYSLSFNLQSSSPIPVTWYLTKVTTPSGRIIQLTYVDKHTIATLNKSTYVATGHREEGNVWLQLEVGCPINYHPDNEADGNLIFPVYLSRIYFSSGAIFLESSISEELRWPTDSWVDQKMQSSIYPYYFENPYAVGSSATGYGNQLQWYKLDQIKVYEYASNPSQLTKEFNLTYNNSSGPTPNRKKLLQVQMKGLNGKLEPPYSFTYNSTLLPSYSEEIKQDHWDFYNGTALNGLTMPKDQYYLSREPDATGNYMKAEILEKIQYPTGAVTVFEYEPHSYSKVVDRLAAYTGNVPFSLIDYATTKVAGGLRVKRILTYNSNTDVTPKLTKEYYYVKDYLPTNTTSSISSGILGGIPTYYWPDYTAKDIDGQTYKLSVFSTGSVMPFGYNTDGSHIGYSEVVEVSKDKSGRINGYTKYKYTNFDSDIWGVPHQDIVGISKDPKRSPYSPFSSCEIQRGKLMSKEIFSMGQALPLEKTLYKYEVSSNGYIRRIFQQPFDICASTTAGAQTCFVTAFKTFTYRFQLKRKEITKTEGTNSLVTVIDYSYTPQNLLSRSIETKSDGSVTEVTNTYPLDYTTNTQITATDWEAIGISALVKRNIINFPIEKITITNNKVTDARLWGYKVFDNNVLPHKVWTYKPNVAISLGARISSTGGGETNLFNPSGLYGSANNFSFRKDEHYSQFPLTFNKYDLRGNILELNTTDNITTSYVWSYRNLLPIAEVKGASNADLPISIGGTSLQAIGDGFSSDSAIRSWMNTLRNSLPNAQITSYTYNAFGITSVTDANGITTYYEYDALGRLEAIKDSSGNILEAYNYKYSSEQ